MSERDAVCRFLALAHAECCRAAPGKVDCEKSREATTLAWDLTDEEYAEAARLLAEGK